MRDAGAGHVGGECAQAVPRIPIDRDAVVLCLRRRRLHQSQVGDLHQSLLVEQQVVRLDVAVDHAAVVRVLQPAGRLEDVADRGFRVELPLAADEVGQRPAGNVLHAEEAGAVRFADVVDLDDVRVRQLRVGVGFAGGEPGHEDRVKAPAPLAHHLERDRPV